MNENNRNIKIAQIYYNKRCNVAQYTFVDGILTDTRYFKLENDQEIPCDPPEEESKVFMPIDLENYENQNIWEIRDKETGEIVDAMEKVEELPIIDGIKLMVKSSEKEGWKKTIEPISGFSEEEREKIKRSVFPSHHDDGSGSPSMVYMDQVKKAVEAILLEQKDQLPPQFYKNIDTSQEFGVSRFLADRMQYLSRLLENTLLINLQDSTYLVSAEIKDRGGNSIKLEHRFKATTNEEAEKLYQTISSQLAGIQQKIWLACWRLANELHRHVFTCQLTDIMKITYPEREGYFSVSERTEFFEHLKSLEQTKILFSIPEKNTKKKKPLWETFEIRFLEFLGRVGGEENKYPQQITISIMSNALNHNKMIYVGAPFKHKTLELHADDTSLATWIQTRKAQRKDESIITVEREFLIQLAGLQRTDISNKTMANKKLLAKLNRFVEKGILISAPTLIEKIVLLKVR